jgi:hypothetical protein
MLEPYSEYGGFSSSFTECWYYSKGDKRVRVDEDYDIPNKVQLENAAKELGLIK